MKAHWAYLKYVLRHKVYMFVEACRLGIPWLGLVHDWHKFLPSEWKPYVSFFYNADGSRRRVPLKHGYFKPGETGDSDFDVAVFKHYKRSWHHWQSWCYPGSQGMIVVPIPERHLREMLADWRGAAQAQGKTRDSVREWYAVNEGKMFLHESAKEWFEKELG